MLSQIRKILYATDLSKNSSFAFVYAMELAKKHEAKIVILHAIEPIPLYVEFYGFLPDTTSPKQQEATIDQVKTHLQNFCQKAEDQYGPPCIDLVSKILVTVGYPPAEILNTADKEECDVIVLGTHGKGFLVHTFLGSVSSAVLHRTRKPVFIVPLPSEKNTMEGDIV
jgi:nucleotide-binding universal stress UspA family protein